MQYSVVNRKIVVIFIIWVEGINIRYQNIPRNKETTMSGAAARTGSLNGKNKIISVKMENTEISTI